MKQTEQYIVTSRLRIVLFYAYLVALGVLALFVAKVVVDNNRLASQSHTAFCSLKAERQRRLDQSLEILKNPTELENAQLIKTFGQGLIVRSVATSRADLAALKDVKC